MEYFDTNRLDCWIMPSKFSREHLPPSNAPKPVICISSDGIRSQYPSIKSAAKEANVKQSGIQAVLRGEQKTTGGYQWQYVNNDL